MKQPWDISLQCVIVYSPSKFKGSETCFKCFKKLLPYIDMTPKNILICRQGYRSHLYSVVLKLFRRLSLSTQRALVLLNWGYVARGFCLLVGNQPDTLHFEMQGPYHIWYSDLVMRWHKDALDLRLGLKLYRQDHGNFECSKHFLSSLDCSLP